MNNLDDLTAWIAAYIEAALLEKPVQPDHQYWWAVEQFMDMNTLEQAEAGWCAILGILGRKPEEKVLGVLAAGPLEDLIHYWGPNFIDRIEQAAWDDVQFRNLLTGVWQSSSVEIWNRVQLAASGHRPIHT
ncbi:MAG TPA: hypothetical protein VF774_11500 [Pseudoduganella sp.]